MTQTVTMPDGSIHNFPDEATPDMISGALNLQPQNQPSQQQSMNANAIGAQATNPIAALTGYAANAEPDLMRQSGSALAALVGYGQGNTANERYQNLESAQGAMKQAGQQLYSEQTKVGQLSSDVLQAAPIIGMAEATAPKAAELIGGAKANIGTAMRVPTDVPPLDPVDILRSHGASQQAASNVNGIIGNNLRTMAGDSVGYAPNAKASIEDLLDQAQNGTEPMNNRAQVVKALNHTLGQFDDEGNMPVQSALDLKVLANENYKVGQNMYKGAWGNVRDAANDVLSDHAIDNPEFGQMLHLQRVHNANDVGEAYNNNDTLQKMFGKDDLQNVSNYDNGITRNVGTDTQKAANSIVSKVKTPEDYAAVSRGIDDPQVQKQFDNAVLANTAPNRGAAVKATLKNAAEFNPLGTAVNAAKTIFPEITPEQQALRAAVKANGDNPTRYYVGQTEGKANDIMSDWQNHMAQSPPDVKVPPKGLVRPSEGFSAGAEGSPTQYPAGKDFNAGMRSPGIGSPLLSEEGTPTDYGEFTGKPNVYSRKSDIPMISSEGTPADYDQSISAGRYGIERGYERGGSIPSVDEWSRLLYKTRKKGHTFTRNDRMDSAKVEAARKVVK